MESHLQPTAPGKSSKKQKAFAPVAGPSHLENPSPDEDTLERTALGSELSVPRSPRPKKELEKSTSNLSSGIVSLVHMVVSHVCVFRCFAPGEQRGVK